MMYKGVEVPDTGIAGVRVVPRGKHKGKWTAFYKGTDGIIFTGTPREHEYQAVFDLTFIKARVYL